MTAKSLIERVLNGESAGQVLEAPFKVGDKVRTFDKKTGIITKILPPDSHDGTPTVVVKASNTPAKTYYIDQLTPSTDDVVDVLKE